MRHTKKHMKFLIPVIGCVVALGMTVAVMSGCEDDPSTDVQDIGTYQTDTADFANINEDQVSAGFVISPAVVTVSSDYYAQQGISPDLVGIEVAFDAQGGDSPYSNWRISNENVARISQSGVATLAGAVGSAEIYVDDSKGRTATASLVATYKQDKDGGNAQAPALLIAPDAVTFTSSISNGPPSDLSGESVTFQVTGGTSPYSFSGSSLGTLTQTSANTARFVVSGTTRGSASVSVADTAGQQVSATIVIE